MADTPGGAASRWFDEHLGSKPIMAVLRGLDPQTTVRLAEAAWDAGCEQVEIPIETDAALPSLAAVVRAGLQRGRVVGAGTIVTGRQASIAVDLGAAYLVSPGLDAELVADRLERGTPFLPGVATASEILTAQALGLRWLKAFPAAVLGPDWIAAMRGPFPTVRFVATGGMNGRNAGAFLAAGCSVVGVGSAFDDLEQIRILRGMIDAHE